MLVIKTRREIAAACDGLRTLYTTVQATSELLDQLTAALDGTTNVAATTALVQLRQAVKDLNQVDTRFNCAHDLLTRYSEAL